MRIHVYCLCVCMYIVYAYTRTKYKILLSLISIYIVNSTSYDETSKRNLKPPPMTLLFVLFSLRTVHRMEWREELVFHCHEKCGCIPEVN